LEADIDTIDINRLAPLDSLSYTPLYIQLADRFAEVILSAGFAPGTRVPTEAECEKRFGVSRLTVRQAMNQLSTRGLILRKRGRGTFVAPFKIHHDLALSFEVESAGSATFAGLTVPIPGTDKSSARACERAADAISHLVGTR